MHRSDHPHVPIGKYLNVGMFRYQAFHILYKSSLLKNFGSPEAFQFAGIERIYLHLSVSCFPLSGNFAKPCRKLKDWKPSPPDLDDPMVAALTEKYKKSPAQVLLRYLIQRNIVVIPKSVSEKRIKENFDVRPLMLPEIFRCEIGF